MSPPSHSEDADPRWDESAQAHGGKTAYPSIDLIAEISNATGRTANEIELGLLSLLPERLLKRSSFGITLTDN